MDLKQPKRTDPLLLSVCMGISGALAIIGIRDNWHDLLVGINIIAFALNFMCLVFHDDFSGPYDNYV